MNDTAPVDRAEDEEDESGPVRRCIVSGERLDVARLIRFVLGPDNTVVPDLSHKLPGRGVWVRADSKALEKATAGGFAKAFRRPVQTGQSFSSAVEAQLVQRLMSLLSFLRRAGEAILGFGRVETALKASRSRLDSLVIASNSGTVDRQALTALGSRLDPPLAILGILTSEEMSLAFGRENVVHAALERGGLAARVRADAERLSGFRPLVPHDWAPT